MYYLYLNHCQPSWLMISVLPVLPPTLRPIIELENKQLVAADLNQLYQKVINKNKRVSEYFNNNDLADSYQSKLYQGQLQQAVDALLDNGKGGAKLVCSWANPDRPLKSLSEIFKGKKGRFRQNLLGKRVDYSGRSVIVVGPQLKLHQCGLPKEIAIELFLPFLILHLKHLCAYKVLHAKLSIIQAKRIIQNHHPIAFKILERILRNHPILLNRAPTLHRLGIQAFQATVIEGKAIFLHPLVCSAFNADFDGDQMAIHVPLGVKAKAESWVLMWSVHNFLSSATGEPSIVPTQDMVLGWYYLTTKQLQSADKSEKKIIQPVNWYSNNFYCQSPIQNSINVFHKYFLYFDDVVLAFLHKQISLNSFVWVKWPAQIENENFHEKPLEIRVDWYGNSLKMYSPYFQYFNRKNQKISQYILTNVGRILLNQIILENNFFMKSGIKNVS